MKTKIVISPSNTKAQEFLEHIQKKQNEHKQRAQKVIREFLAAQKKS